MNMLKKSKGALSKKKKSKKKLAIALILLAGVALGAKFCMGDKPTNTVLASEIGNLALDDLSEKVSANGVVIAEKDASVYTTQTLPVKTILVKENTFVQKGQILAYLDDKSLRKQIQVKEATLGAQARNLALQVAIAKDKYETAKTLLNQGKTSTVLSAEGSLATAKATWQAAEKVYSDYKKSLEQGYNPESSSYQSTLESSRQAVETARQAYAQAKERYKDGVEQNSANESDHKTARKDREALTFSRNQLQQDLANHERQFKEESDKNATISANLAKLEAEMNQAKAEWETASETDKSAKKMNYETKKIAYESYKTSNPLSNQAEERYYRTQNELNDANRELSNAESDYSRTKGETESYDKAKIARKQELENAELALKKAEENLQTVKSQGNSSRRGREDVLRTHRQSADTAKKAYEEAQKNLELAKIQASGEVKTLLDGLHTSQVSASDKTGIVELAGMYRDLEDTIIRAPMSGTLTHIYAKQGIAPSGALFSIEALDQLFTEVKVKTQDVIKIRPNMKVKVKRDGDDAHEFFGEVVSVAQSAEDAGAAPSTDGKGSSGSSSKAPEFNVRIRLLEAQGNFLVGMKTRAEIIISEVKSTFSVPLESVIIKDNGKEAILAMDPGKKENEYILRAVPVKTGVMTDTSIAIEGKDLKEGMQVLLQPKEYRGGEVVTMTNDDMGEEGNNG